VEQRRKYERRHPRSVVGAESCGKDSNPAPSGKSLYDFVVRDRSKRITPAVFPALRICRAYRFLLVIRPVLPIFALEYSSLPFAAVVVAKSAARRWFSGGIATPDGICLSQSFARKTLGDRGLGSRPSRARSLSAPAPIIAMVISRQYADIVVWNLTATQTVRTSVPFLCDLQA